MRPFQLKRGSCLVQVLEGRQIILYKPDKSTSKRAQQLCPLDQKYAVTLRQEYAAQLSIAAGEPLCLLVTEDLLLLQRSDHQFAGGAVTGTHGPAQL